MKLYSTSSKGDWVLIEEAAQATTAQLLKRAVSSGVFFTTLLAVITFIGTGSINWVRAMMLIILLSTILFVVRVGQRKWARKQLSSKQKEE